uniref:C2orf72-like C-terminal domain-containing protein n=1 Tax=Pelusios castaneus TaxID=367368 RepID=A0A8C8RF81_9SAUR
MEGGPAERALRELEALLERAGGQARVLLAEEVPEGAPRSPALLGTFSRELFGERPGAPAAGGGGQPAAPQVRVWLGPGGAARQVRSRLVFLLCRAGSLRARARLREIARDLRSRLPRAPPAALVAVLVQPGPGEEAAAPRLEALLREGFLGRRGLPETVQAGAYSPGRPDGTLPVRRAACRALRAALQPGAGTGGFPGAPSPPPAGGAAPRGPARRELGQSPPGAGRGHTAAGALLGCARGGGRVGPLGAGSRRAGQRFWPCHPAGTGTEPPLSPGTPGIGSPS